MNSKNLHKNCDYNRLARISLEEAIIYANHVINKDCKEKLELRKFLGFLKEEIIKMEKTDYEKILIIR